jgi:hypothetical protein
MQAYQLTPSLNDTLQWGCKGSGGILNLSTGRRLVLLDASAALHSGGRPPTTHWIEGWVSPKAGVGDLENMKFFDPFN